jgi:hypothetical protein
MHKKTWVLVSFVLCFSLVFMGCGSSRETPEQAVTNLLTAIKNLDVETIQKYVVYEDLFSGDPESEDLIENEENTKLLTNKLSFKILSSTSEGDTAVVKTEITSIDMAVILGEYMQQAMALAFSNAFAGGAAKSDEEIDAQAEQIFKDLLNRENNKMKTSTIDIKLTKTETGWRLNSDEEFEDAILGGLISASKAIDESFGGGDSPESKLQEIRNFVISDIWNKGFCDISHYLGDGKSSTGESLDIDFTLEQLADAMGTKAEYDTFIDSLEGEKYAKIKQIWSKLSAEIDRLYNQVLEKKPETNDSGYDFDTGRFNQYMDAFIDEVRELD